MGDEAHLQIPGAADAFAVLPLIRTLPASQASFATVRLLISLETFKNLSSLIVISPFLLQSIFSLFFKNSMTIDFFLIHIL